MPKTKFQEVIFTILMVLFMVYVMICYNISLNVGKMTNQVLWMAFHELLIMVPVAFILEMFIVGKLSYLLAFRIVNTDDRPIFILLAISAMTICLMCPVMSFAATLLFKNPGNELIAVWLQTTVLNFPMAFFLQIFFVGPLVRFLFRFIFKKQLNK